MPMPTGKSDVDGYIDSPGAAVARMIELERAIAEMDARWTAAEAAYVRANERKKLREAQLRFTFKGRGTVEDINAMVRDALWGDPDGYMQTREEADAVRQGCKASFQAKQTELSSIKARLDALVRTAGHDQP